MSILSIPSTNSQSPTPQPTIAPKLCNETLQCESTTLTENKVYCDGFYGCTESKITASSITCDGSYSCSKSTLSTIEYLFCSGKSSCYNSTLAYSDGGVTCHGQYGCAWSKQLSSKTMGVNCGGYMSCMHANIKATGVTTIYINISVHCPFFLCSIHGS